MIRTGAINWGSPINRSCGLNAGLVGCWIPRPGINGSVWYDLCGRFNATLQATPSWRPYPAQGAFGCVQFAAAQYVTCPAVPDLQLTTSPLSLVVRYRPSGDYTSTQGLFACNQNTANANWVLEFGRTDNKFTFLNNSSAIHLTSTATVSADDDTIVILTRGGTTGSWQLNFYINGQPDASGSTASNPESGTGNLSIGAWNNTASAFAPCTGLIAAAMLYNRQLTAGEAMAITTELRSGMPRMFNRSERRFGYVAAAASFNPAWALNATTLIGAGCA